MTGEGYEPGKCNVGTTDPGPYIEHAGVYQDDGQIDRIEIERGEVRAPGHVEVEIREMRCDATTSVSG